MPSTNGITAEILIDGVPVPEYGVQVNAAARKATCWIESKDGSEFSLRVTNNCGTVGTFRFYLDGDEGAYYMIRPGESPVAAGKVSGPTSILPYMFGKLNLTDDDDLAVKEEAQLKELGTLRVDFRRVKEGPQVPYRPSTVQRQQQEKFFNEKSKKAQLSHSTQFGAARHRPAHRGTVSSIIPVDLNPFCQIEFHYRSRLLLELKGLVEPLPVPEPVKTEKKAKVVIDIDDEYPSLPPPRKRKGNSDRYEIDLTQPGAKAVKLEDAPVKEEDIVQLD